MNQDFNNALDFDEKNCFEKIKTCWETRSQRNIYLANLHQKTSKLAFFVHSQKSCSGKSCFFPSKKVLWIKTFENNQFLNRLLYNASHFDSRSSNASDLEPFFRNSTKFESKKLERVRFRKKSFTTHQVLKWKWFVEKKTDFDENSAFRKSLLNRFTPKKAHFCSYAFYQKPTIVLRKGKKQFSYQDFWKESDFETSFQQRVRFESSFSKWNNFLVIFTQLVIFCISNFTACQILKHPIYHTSGFELKFQQRNRFSRETGSKTTSFLGQFAFKIFFSLYIVKMSNLRFPSFLERLILRAIFLEKKHSLNRKLWEKSDFESIFSQRPRLFNKTKLFVSKFELSST